MSLAGNLKTVSFPDILQLLATGKKTGILEVKTATRQKEVAFKGGNIIYASSLNSNEDLLGNMLLRQGRITKHDLERAISLHKQTGRQLGTPLIDMNLFDKEELINRKFKETESITDDDPKEPTEHVPGIEEFIVNVKDIIDVEMFIPGCPPTTDNIIAAISPDNINMDCSYTA